MLKQHNTKIKFALYTLTLYLFASSNILTACCSGHSEPVPNWKWKMQDIIVKHPDEPSIHKKLMPYKHHIAAWQPVCVAISHKKVHATIFFLENGDSANAKSDQYYLSPLTLAVETQDPFFVSILLKHNADPYAIDRVTHQSPYKRALEKGNLDIFCLIFDEVEKRKRWSDLRSAWIGTVVRVSAGPKTPAPIQTPQDRCTLS